MTATYKRKLSKKNKTQRKNMNYFPKKSKTLKTKTQALLELNKGLHGLDWKEKAYTLGQTKEHVIENVMFGNKAFHHHHVVHIKKNPKFKL
jgi:hypothetical protein